MNQKAIESNMITCEPTEAKLLEPAAAETEDRSSTLDRVLN